MILDFEDYQHMLKVRISGPMPMLMLNFSTTDNQRASKDASR